MGLSVLGDLEAGSESADGVCPAGCDRGGVAGAASDDCARFLISGARLWSCSSESTAEAGTLGLPVLGDLDAGSESADGVCAKGCDGGGVAGAASNDCARFVVSGTRLWSCSSESTAKERTLTLVVLGVLDAGSESADGVSAEGWDGRGVEGWSSDDAARGDGEAAASDSSASRTKLSSSPEVPAAADRSWAKAWDSGGVEERSSDDCARGVGEAAALDSGSG